MLKRSLKKIGLSLLFAGVLSVGLSINSASAGRDRTIDTENLFTAIENVLKEKDISYKYGVKDFWEKISEKLGFKIQANTACVNFSRILERKGISLGNKGNYWRDIFKPYKEARTSDESLTLEAYISAEIAKNPEYKKQDNGGEIKERHLWTYSENEALYTIVENYLKKLKGKPLPQQGGAWNEISNICNKNEILKNRGKNWNNAEIRKHFCKINFREKGQFNENGKRMTEVLNGFSKYISGKPKNPLSLKDYIEEVKAGKIKLPAALGGDSETHLDPGYDEQQHETRPSLSDEEILAKVRKMLGMKE